MAASYELEQLADRIRQIHASDPSGAEKAIQGFLEGSLAGIPKDEKIKVLGELIRNFESSVAGEVCMDQVVLTRICSFLLGKKVSKAELSSAELLQRLADSLNTIFDMLNQLVSVINRTFLGERQGVETIRQVIGFHLEGEDNAKSLESFLGQINKAFLSAQEAFKMATEKKVREILVEFDPEQIARASGGRFKLGPMRKAESFELYADKFKTLRKWFDSGRFMEEVLREFENNCQKLFLE